MDSYISYPGTWIVLEGMDGAGTTTATFGLTRRLFTDNKKAHVLETREPSHGHFGSKLRQMLVDPDTDISDPKIGKIFAELFIKDRYDHMYRFVLPTLKEGGIVVQDRGMYSTIAYQGMQGMPHEDLVAWHRFMPTVPDAVIILDIDVETALSRRSVASGHNEVFDEREPLIKIEHEYKNLPELMRKLAPEHPIHTIDATVSVDEVLESCWNIVRPLLPYYKS